MTTCCQLYIFGDMTNVELPGDDFSILIRSVFTLNGLILRSGERVSKRYGQSIARLHVLARANYKPRTVSEIARYIGVSRQSVQRLADDLADDGLLRYSANPYNKRAQLVSITPAGAKILDSIYTDNKKITDSILEDLDKASLPQLSASLDAISQAVAAHLKTSVEKS